MASDVYGIVACDVNQSPILKAKSKFRHGRLRCSYDEYEASALPVGKQITMGWVPGGAVLLGCRLKYDALGAGTSISVGDKYDCDRFITAVASVGAGDVGGCGTDLVIGAINIQDSTMGSEHTGWGYVFACDTDILVTNPYAGGALTGTIKLLVTYATD